MFHELRTKVQVFTRKHTSDVSSIARSLGVVGGGGGGGIRRLHTPRELAVSEGVWYTCVPHLSSYFIFFLFFCFFYFSKCILVQTWPKKINRCPLISEFRFACKSVREVI